MDAITLWNRIHDHAINPYQEYLHKQILKNVRSHLDKPLADLSYVDVFWRGQRYEIPNKDVSSWNPKVSRIDVDLLDVTDQIDTNMAQLVDLQTKTKKAQQYIARIFNKCGYWSEVRHALPESCHQFLPIKEPVHSVCINVRDEEMVNLIDELLITKLLI